MPKIDIRNKIEEIDSIKLIKEIAKEMDCQYVLGDMGQFDLFDTDDPQISDLFDDYDYIWLFKDGTLYGHYGSVMEDINTDVYPYSDEEWNFIKSEYQDAIKKVYRL